jgi:hypothetical protein
VLELRPLMAVGHRESATYRSSADAVCPVRLA